ncbi:Fur family transcriptional regulator [Cocleimonas flava]|uniref:Fur family zinc uptake transcriptional regulator n=1 Tax=Cocleimonas flava TaxID=634765 RepID=A0A4R1EV67_9GAMM|nr:Fur family transcriptional regulator [Cocleimonas flava]TCJ85173.1 Fur family zinc uptake transcriptional regulator [Cocleimonas flava]
MIHCEKHNHCISTAIKQGEEICNEKGLKFTAIRRKVLELVWETHKPAKAYDILEKLAKEDGAPVPPTVYRALDFLLQNGLVHRINSLNAFVGCSHPGLHNQCFFMICTHCEKVTECCTTELGKAIDITTKENSFTRESVSLEILGACQSCSA